MALAIAIKRPKHFACDSRPIVRREIAFPNTYHLPALGTEGAVNKPVARPVAGEFLRPPFRAAFGCWRMLRFRASMPKAAVHEDDNAFSSKDEIRSSEKRLASAPAVNSMHSEESDHSQFCVAISPTADARHHGRAFLGCKNVRSHSPRSPRKKPMFGWSGVPTSKARSSIRLPSSHDVSGNSAHP